MRNAIPPPHPLLASSLSLYGMACFVSHDTINCAVGLFGTALPPSKALVLRDRLRAIIPNVMVDARVSMFRKEEADSLLDIDVPRERCFVLDCIDDLATKAELIAQCSRRGLRVLSSMGAGLKSDPTRLHIAKLTDCTRDRLAMRVRYTCAGVFLYVFHITTAWSCSCFFHDFSLFNYF